VFWGCAVAALAWAVVARRTAGEAPAAVVSG
jgi:hypothetical protein